MTEQQKHEGESNPRLESGTLTRDALRIISERIDNISDMPSVTACTFIRSLASPTMTNEVYISGVQYRGLLAIDYPGCVCPAIIPDVERNPATGNPVGTDTEMGEHPGKDSSPDNVISLKEQLVKQGRVKGMRQESNKKKKQLAKATAKAQRAIQREFNSWKDFYVSLIRNESKVESNPDGSVQFILPRELVEIVWTTSIYEFVKIVEMQAEKEGQELSDSELGIKATTMMKERIGQMAQQITASQILEKEDEETGDGENES